MRALSVCLLLGAALVVSARDIPRRPSQYAAQVVGDYIVVLDKTVVKTTDELNSFADRLSLKYDVTVRKTYTSFKMLLIHSESDLSAILESLPEVQYVEPDGIAYGAQACTSQLNPRTWGLDRIDQRGILGYSDADPTDSVYFYDPNVGAGAGVDVYVVDSGIEITDPEFEGRAIWGYTAPDLREVDEDLNGHGTHCAGTVGSASYGVAKAVSLTAVKVLGADNSGPWSAIIDGLDWTLIEYNIRGNTLGSVISMSVGGGAYTPVDDALQACIDGGITSVLAAMNENSDTCDSSPARVPAAITVGAVDITDTSAIFTNYGSCVDLFGPGVDVVSTHLDGGTASYSGTSMATPHVAGVLARYMSTLSSNPTPAGAWSWLQSQATVDAITFRSGHESSPNLMLYVDCQTPAA